MHSPKYDLVRGYYKDKMWTLAQVKNAVKKNWITVAEYEEITGKKYDQ